MASKGKISDIVDVKAVEAQLKVLNDGVSLAAKNIENVVGQAVLMNAAFKDAKGIKDLTEAYKALSKEQIAAGKEKSKMEATAQKLIDKENKIIEALNNEGKTGDELKAKISALIVTKNKLLNTTEEGRKKIVEYNKQIDESKKKLTEQGSAHEKQRDRIGAYSDAVDGAKTKIKDYVLALGTVAGVMALAKFGFDVFKKAIATSEAAFDSFKEVAKGAEFATMQFYRQIEQGDFSNLLENMREATKIGREYEASLDLIEHRKKAINASHDKEAANLADLAEKVRTGVDLDTGKIYTTQQLLKLSNELAEKQKTYYTRLQENSKDEVETNLKTLTGLINVNQQKKKSAEQVKADLSDYIELDAGNKELRKSAEKLNESIKTKNDLTKTDISLSGLIVKLTVGSVNKDNVKKEIEQIYNRTDAVSKYAKLLKMYEGTIGIEYIDNYIKAVKGKADADAAYDVENKRLKSKQASIVKKDSEDQAKIYEDAVKKRKELAKKEKEDNEKIQDLQTSMIIDANEKELQEITLKYNREYEAAKGNKKLQLAISEKYIFDIKQANDKAEAERIKKEKEILTESEKNQKESSDFMKQLTDDADKDILQAKEAKAKKEIEIEKQKEDIKKQIRDKEFELARAGIDTLSSFQNIGFQKDLDLIDERSKKDDEAREKELKAAGNNQELKDKINAKYDAAEKKRDKERKKIEHDKAIANRDTAKLNITLDTAQAIVSHLKTPWMIPFDILMGALQMAVVLAAPIPKYKHGRNGGDDELAIVGDGGTEGIQLSSGERFLTPNKDTLVHLPKGASVIPNYELFKNSAFDNVPTFENSYNMDLQSLGNKIDSLQGGFIMVSETVKHKKELHVNISAAGLEIMEKNGNSFSKYVNNKYRN
ncbi:MAG TPA: hypothetical protein VIK86_05625 [Candidatus Paceibacterota bacterium]